MLRVREDLAIQCGIVRVVRAGPHGRRRRPRPAHAPGIQHSQVSLKRRHFSDWALTPRRDALTYGVLLDCEEGDSSVTGRHFDFFVHCTEHDCLALEAREPLADQRAMTPIQYVDAIDNDKLQTTRLRDRELQTDA